MTYGSPQKEGNGPWFVCLYTHQSNRYAGQVIGDSPADATVNAAKICRSCNSHAALVAASIEFLAAATQVRQLKDGVSIQISAAASTRYMQAEEELRAALKADTEGHP